MHIFSQPCVDRAAQAELRLKLGKLYENNDLVFATDHGKPLDQCHLNSRYYKPLLKAANKATREEAQKQLDAALSAAATAAEKQAARRHFEGRLKKALLPENLRPYDLRHSCATILMEMGKSPKLVAERLGHASTTMTMDVYSHVTPTMQQDAADALNGLF